MATNKIIFLPKEIEDFTNDLYDYIWMKHNIMFSSLGEEFTDKLSLNFDKPKKISNFDECIGNAVYCSQFLLREYCNYMFKRYGTELIESNILLCICVFDVIVCWTKYRNDEFTSIIDSAAIAAEVVLFCDAKLKVRIEQDRASYVFKSFLAIFFHEEFLAKGGWSSLKAKALQDYQNLYSDLEPFISLKNHPYEKMNHSCDLIKLIRKSPVCFPIHISMFCKNCKKPSDGIHSGYDDIEKSFYYMFKYSVTSKSLLKNGDILQVGDQMRQCILAAFEDDTKQYKLQSPITINRTFLCILLGGEDQKDSIDSMECEKNIPDKEESQEIR